MATLDQVLLLEEKVESAVQKIAQLKLENDALRIQCAELTKALSQKSEQLSAFASDQNKIEEGILKALERLDTVENSVLQKGAITQVATQTVQQPEPITVASTEIPAPAPVSVPEIDSLNQTETQPVKSTQIITTTTIVNETPAVPQTETQQIEPEVSFDSDSEPVNTQEPENAELNTASTMQSSEESSEIDDKPNGQFYIF